MDMLINKDNLLGSTEWTAPSNIAFIKYWGKKENQVPANPSLSMTLSRSITRTTVDAFKSNNRSGLTWNFYFEGKKSEAFEEKLRLFFSRIKGEVELGNHLHLEIKSENSFPHSAGIASSASSMAALSLCILSLEEQIRKISYTNEDFFRLASRISRLGSGSACRSLYGGYCLWGKTTSFKKSSDKFAVPLVSVHPLFDDLQDTILIVDSGKKEISSSQGHSLMNNHPFEEARFRQAEVNIEKILYFMETGNWVGFAEVVESEALSLHSMMLTSNPWYMLLKPHSLEIILKIKEFRNTTAIPITFTLDAGPNIHLLYPSEYADPIISFVNRELAPYCEKGRFIQDKLGYGPVISKGEYE